MRTSDLVVGIPCFNEEARVAGLAASLQALDPAPGAVYAVDDGSDDATASMLKASGIHVLSQPTNRGLGAARNLLWKKAAAEGFAAISYLDADVIPPPSYISEVIALFVESQAAGVGGRNEESDSGLMIDRWRARFWPQSLGSDELLCAPMLVGACSSYRVDALEAVGGFDVAFRTHGEDVDIGRRLVARGFSLRYSPSLCVQHQRSDSLRTLLRGCYLHCREGMRATTKTPLPSDQGAAPTSLLWGMSKKAVTAPCAAILKRRDPIEASIGLMACSAGLVGYAAAGLFRWSSVESG